MTNVEEISNLEKILGISFQNIDFLRQALTHRSYINENRDYKLGHNERLEFLGDAILEVLVTEKLYEDYPTFDEGILTSIRSALVRTEMLATKSKALQYGVYLLLSAGEEASGGRERDYILANSFEAVLGAIYKDQGIDVCREFLSRVLFPEIKTIIENKSYIDNKSQLQEIAQAQRKETPRYELVREDGPDHEKIFTMAVFVGQKSLALGTGKSKQDAEQDAAGAALAEWK